ncbi:nuclear transcription factor Y, gamma [Paragonimus westermani]|uniref:Nuclear transcription factor Y subunit gamma n=1 Tax=Paragonimus westermani TaxID=34504 RepID=A0A5J4NHP8_9TREM|nr:nuclear transcription factor Y, gamma [Paragonimus westermani]
MDYAVDQLSDCQAQMLSYWETIRLEIDNLKCDHSAFKTQDLPLARIKKIMKLDDDIKSMMISAEAPILFAKAAELFIRELTLRAWIHTERNRRRTLQRNDISMAVSDGDTDQFDFLIDIVPREESRGHRRVDTVVVFLNSSIYGRLVSKLTLYRATQLAACMISVGDNRRARKLRLNIESSPRPAQASPSSVAGSNASGTSTSNLKAENSAASVAFVTTTNGRTSNQVVPVDVSASQPQTLTIALGGASTSNPSAVGSSAASTVLQGHTPTIQFATAIPSTGSVMATAQSTVTNSASNTSATVSSASAAAPIQYVLQLPVGAGGATSGQPFQIQLLPQHFQTSSTDAISGATAGQGGTLLTDANGNTIPVLQVVTQAAGGLALPTIVQESNGQRTQLLQLQRPTLLLQQSGSMLGATAVLTTAELDEQSQQLAYSVQPHQLMSSEMTAEVTSTPQVLLSFSESGACVVSSGVSDNCLDTATVLDVVTDQESGRHLVARSIDDDADDTVAETSPVVLLETTTAESDNEHSEVEHQICDVQISSRELLQNADHFSSGTQIEIHDVDPRVLSDTLFDDCVSVKPSVPDAS